jgi:hypothetical protein
MQNRRYKATRAIGEWGFPSMSPSKVKYVMRGDKQDVYLLYKIVEARVTFCPRQIRP